MTATAAHQRTPCPACGTLIAAGARKCRGCKRWLDGTKPRRGHGRSLMLVIAALLSAVTVVISSRESTVGEAPPLTPMVEGASVAEGSIGGDPASAALGSDFDARVPEPLEPSPNDIHHWRARHFQLDVHPLDLVFHASGKSLYVSADDASLRQYDVRRGQLLHMQTVPAQGDRIRLLHDRYIAVIRLRDAAHVPVVDTQTWNDPIMLWVGLAPSDVVAIPDGLSAVTTSNHDRHMSWFDLKSGRKLGNIRLPHAARRLYVLRGTDQRPLIGAVGRTYRDDRSTGAFLDLFDPVETPFGATRRSIDVGRDPRNGAVTADGSTILLVDRVSNEAVAVSVDATTERKRATVGQEPMAAFLMNGDRHGVTLDTGSRTATVLHMKRFERVSSILLEGEPRGGAVAAEGRALFVSLGGSAWPPQGSGVAVLAGDPPRLVATLETGRGSSQVAVSPDGRRAAVANYFAKTITVIEPE